MDAVIALHKPHMRLATPGRAASPGRNPGLAEPSDHRSHLTTPEQLATASSRIVVVAPAAEWWAVRGTVESLAHHGHPVLLIEIDTASEAAIPVGRLAPRPVSFPHQTLTFRMPAGDGASHEKALAEWLPVGSGDTVFVPWRHDGVATHESCARATLAACRTVNAKCIEFPSRALDSLQPAHARLRRSVLQCVRLPQAGNRPPACEWTLA
ncbi:hypothetical protein GN316_04625 [Xylophilus sp. Kf1]|nr:hypothetical protein [Xylophilus sp. Kf1]